MVQSGFVSFFLLDWVGLGFFESQIADEKRLNTRKVKRVSNAVRWLNLDGKICSNLRVVIHSDELLCNTASQNEKSLLFAENELWCYLLSCPSQLNAQEIKW